jgi:uncharacterized membrane protein YvbJ
MICKQCNFENDSAARFCESCGASLWGENPAQANKGLMKIIWGSIALLYIGVIVCFVTGLATESHYTEKDVMLIQAILSLFVLVAIWVLFYVKQIKRSFAIVATLLSVYALIGSYTVWNESSIVLFLLVFFAAAATILIYKNSFAENQELL